MQYIYIYMSLVTVLKLKLLKWTEWPAWKEPGPLKYWCLDCTYFKYAVHFVLDIVLNIKQYEQRVILINIIVLFNNCIINSIGNLKQSVSFGRNSVFVIWSKGQGLGLQTKVKIAILLLLIVRAGSRHSNSKTNNCVFQ